MTAAVRAVIPFASARCGCTASKRPAFRPMPRSIRLLEKTRLPREGYAREYLCINGDLAGPPALRPVERCKAVTEPTAVTESQGKSGPWDGHGSFAIVFCITRNLAMNSGECWEPAI